MSRSSAPSPLRAKVTQVSASGQFFYFQLQTPLSSLSKPHCCGEVVTSVGIRHRPRASLRVCLPPSASSQNPAREDTGDFHPGRELFHFADGNYGTKTLFVLQTVFKLKDFSLSHLFVCWTIPQDTSLCCLASPKFLTPFLYIPVPKEIEVTCTLEVQCIIKALLKKAFK